MTVNAVCDKHLDIKQYQPNSHFYFRGTAGMNVFNRFVLFIRSSRS